MTVVKKLDEIEIKINDLYKQIFLNYATWYLEEKEREMGLNKKLDEFGKTQGIMLKQDFLEQVLLQKNF